MRDSLAWANCWVSAVPCTVSALTPIRCLARHSTAGIIKARCLPSRAIRSRVWLQRLDSNQRSSGYEPDEMTNFSTLRLICTTKKPASVWRQASANAQVYLTSSKILETTIRLISRLTDAAAVTFVPSYAAWMFRKGCSDANIIWHFLFRKRFFIPPYDIPGNPSANLSVAQTAGKP